MSCHTTCMGEPPEEYLPVIAYKVTTLVIRCQTSPSPIPLGPGWKLGTETSDTELLRIRAGVQPSSFLNAATNALVDWYPASRPASVTENPPLIRVAACNNRSRRRHSTKRR